MKATLALLFKGGLSIGGLGILGYLLICGYLFTQQTRFIFFPVAGLETTPASLGLTYEDVWLTPDAAVVSQTQIPNTESDQSANAASPPATAAEETLIHGWWIPSEANSAANSMLQSPRDRTVSSSGQSDSPEPNVLLYLHGNGGNLSSNVYHAARFQRMGFSVLAIDYRGYGWSRGDFPTEQQVYEDAEAAWTYLVNSKEVQPQQIVIYGHSLGGAIATELATRQPDAAGLIVEGSFTSIEDMTAWKGGYRLIPVSLILRQRFDSIHKVPRLQMPVLFIHGTEDDQVPHHMSEQLYAAAPDPKQLWLVPVAGHNDVAAIAEEEYFKQIHQFQQSLRSQLVQP